MNAKILGGVLLGALAMTGCGGDAGTATNAAKNVAATNAGKTAVNAVTNAATNAMPTGTVGALPADFPKDIPVYTGATVVAGATGGAMGKGASFSTADDVAKVADYYKAELAKQGWTDVKTMAAGPTNNVTASKDKRMLAISIMKGPDGKTMINVGESVKP